jgi:hypothetical protein
MPTLTGLSLEQALYRADAVYRQPQWSFDTRTARYRNASTGRFLSQRDALQLTERSIAAASRELETQVVALAQGVTSLGDWQRSLALLLKQLHLGQFILGRGGIAHTTPADFLEVGRILKDEYRYLEGFGRDLAAGRLSVAQARARARLYLAKSRLSFWAGQRQAQAQGPLPVEMRRSLAPVEHCTECITYAAAGWMPLGALPLPTVDCSCRSNCRCTVEYR